MVLYQMQPLSGVKASIHSIAEGKVLTLALFQEGDGRFLKRFAFNTEEGETDSEILAIHKLLDHMEDEDSMEIKPDHEGGRVFTKFRGDSKERPQGVLLNKEGDRTRVLIPKEDFVSRNL